MRVEGKVAIVTGAAQGIGLAYAERLVKEGAKVAIVDLKIDEARDNAKRVNSSGDAAIAIACDVSSEEDTLNMASEVIDAFGGIDILVNNAAIYEGYLRYSFMEIPLDYWNQFLSVNLTGALLCAKAVVPSMVKRGGGKIINQSSASGAKATNHYGISKLAIQGLTVGLARELGGHKICVNCIAPGVVTTSATTGAFNEEALEKMRQELTVIGRLGTVEDMADALIYLASKESDFVTGQILHVDGGQIMNPL